MATYRYNRHGKLIGYTKSGDEIQKEQVSTAFGIILLVIGSPLILLSYDIFLKVESTEHLHPVYAGLIAAAPSLLVLIMLWKSKVVRYVYLGSESVLASFIVYKNCIIKMDHVWAGFYACITLLFGLLLTYVLSNYGSNE